MAQVGQGVDDWGIAVGGKVDKVLVREHARDDTSNVAREDMCGIRDGLTPVQLHVVCVEIQCVGSEFERGDLEGHPGTGGSFLEDHGNRLAFQVVLLLSRHGIHLQFVAKRDDLEDLLFREILEAEQVPSFEFCGHNPPG